MDLSGIFVLVIFLVSGPIVESTGILRFWDWVYHLSPVILKRSVPDLHPCFAPTGTILDIPFPTWSRVKVVSSQRVLGYWMPPGRRNPTIMVTMDWSDRIPIVTVRLAHALLLGSMTLGLLYAAFLIWSKPIFHGTERVLYGGLSAVLALAPPVLAVRGARAYGEQFIQGYQEATRSGHPLVQRAESLQIGHETTLGPTAALPRTPPSPDRRVSTPLGPKVFRAPDGSLVMTDAAKKQTIAPPISLAAAGLGAASLLAMMILSWNEGDRVMLGFGALVALVAGLAKYVESYGDKTFVAGADGVRVDVLIGGWLAIPLVRIRWSNIRAFEVRDLYGKPVLGLVGKNGTWQPLFSRFDRESYSALLRQLEIMRMNAE